MPYKHLRPPVDIVNRSAVKDGKAEDITVTVSFKLTAGSARQMSNQQARSTAAHILLAATADEQCEKVSRKQRPADTRVRRKSAYPAPTAEEMREEIKPTEAKKPTLWFNDSDGELFATSEWEIFEWRVMGKPTFYAYTESESGHTAIIEVKEHFAKRWGDDVKE